MCVMSMVMDHYTDKWQRLVLPEAPPPAKPLIPKEDIAEFYELLERARKYDREHDQPDCELNEKQVALKRLAEQLGVEIAFV